MMTPDEGYYFGLGAFETIAVEEGEPVFLEAVSYTHLRQGGIEVSRGAQVQVDREKKIDRKIIRG